MEEYKLCPKCNNPLDKKILQCPYCWENLWVNVWWTNVMKWDPKTVEKNKSSLLRIIIILFIILPLLSSIISFIFELISSLFE